MTSSASFNIGALKTVPGFLMFCEAIIASICLGILLHEKFSTGSSPSPEEAFLYLVLFAFLVPTFLLLVSSLVSAEAAELLQKTIFAFLIHLTAFIFYLAAIVNFLVFFSKSSSEDMIGYAECMTISVLGVMNTVLYSLSTYISYQSYKST